MTSYRLPDGTVVGPEELPEIIKSGYYTTKDFDESLDRSNGPVTALGMQFKASEILRKVKPDLYEVLYDEDIDEIVEEHLEEYGITSIEDERFSRVTCRLWCTPLVCRHSSILIIHPMV